MTKQLRQMAIATLLVGSALSSLADRVSQEEAQVIASEFLSLRSGKSAELLHLTLQPTSERQPLYYVFNAGADGGFVIVSAESSATPVLGYSLEGNYNVSKAPEAFRWMMSGLEREIKAAPAEQKSCSAEEMKSKARKAARAADAQKLLSTPSWSQEAPFNSLIPGRPLVGCVGTAMATVMKYHNHPAAGTGAYDGVDFSSAYDWANMRTDNYRSGYTATEGDAVALLMYHASKSIDTQYAMSGSSAYEVRVPAALSTYFRYDPGVSYKKRAEVSTQAEWDRIVKDEIDAGRPVIYCGQDVTAGHAFVCDGYQGEYLHFNWGWGGSANGYFLSTALNPTVSRQHHYNNLNTIIYNIKPASGAISQWSAIHITADGNQPGIGSNLTDLASGQTFDVRVGNLKNLSYDNFSGKIAVALYSAGGALKGLLCTPQSFNLQSMQTLYNGWVKLNGCKLPTDLTVAADDVIRIVTQANGESEWLPVAGELPTINELAVSIASPASFAVTLPTGVAGVEIAGSDSVIRGWDYAFTVTPASENDVITVKANGYVLTPGNGYKYIISNVCEDQKVTVLVQKASEVKAKRSIWVETPGTLADLISETESGTIKDLSLFGSIDARDFAFMKNNMRLERVDLSGVYISAYGTDQANAIPREAFRGVSSLTEVILPKSVNRLNNGCFRQTGLTSITIPAGVKTYEYNIFVAASRLQHIYVGRESAEFINWCVLSGVKVATATLHVPNERAVANYSKAENWNTIGNIIVDPIVEADDVNFAVMDNADVMFDSETLPGRLAKGSDVRFTCSYIPDNDNRMEVYANSTLLSPDAEGVYSLAVNANTIVHFNLITPTAIDHDNASPWKLTDKLGSVGLLTDAVNVIPGQEFTVRVNTLNIPQYYDQYFWAIALTDAAGNIKEFISPVNLWTAGASDSFKMNVNCCVKESKVREGNLLALVTSGNKRTWNRVKATGDDVVDFLPALNNQKPVYNITIADVKGATVSGVPETAVHGRDITIKVTPSSAANRVDLAINGKPVATGATSVNYTHVVKENTDIDIKVYDPKAEGSVTYTVYPGELMKKVTANNICANVKVVGNIYSSELQSAFTQPFAIKTVKTLDLSEVNIVETAPGNGDANFLNHPPFFTTSGVSDLPASIVESIILPDNVVRIGSGFFQNCPKIKEVTLPESLISIPIKPSKAYIYGLATEAFLGCDGLEIIRIPGAPQTKDGVPIVAHHNPKSTTNSAWYQYYNLGCKDPKKVTVIVPEEYLNVYRTTKNDEIYGNAWKAHGYNILSETPVYGVNFDPARIVTADPDLDVRSMASFLGENVSLSSMVVSDKLKLANPAANCFVYDNGKLVQPTEEGYIPVEFFNPAKTAEGVGNHDIKVFYTYDVAFNTTSDLFTIGEPEVENEAEYKSGEFDRTNALAPVLKNVAENSTVRFRLDYNSEHAEAIESHVMLGQQEITPDEEGYYAIDVTNANREVTIFAVPTDGATLNANEIASLNPEQTEGISSIALTGQISSEDLSQALKCFPGIENLDLSDMEGELTEGAFAGMSELTVVSLPAVTEIADNMFSGCSSLQAVEIPASVVSVGDGAFKDCKSLESIKLTGINSIGEGAFSGCENLTNITLLADHTSSASEPQQAKGRRAAGVSEKAFEGLNPNCFIILDEGVTMPVTHGNILTTSSGMISETQPDGSVLEREGRTYSAKQNVSLKAEYPMAIPHAFTLDENTAITLTSENDGWTGMAVPFDVMSIKDAEGNEVEITISAGQDSDKKANYIFTLEDNAEGLSSVAAIKANTPVLFHAATAGEYTFAATTGKVPATPTEISVNGKEYSLHATYKEVSLPAETTYLLNEKATAFVAGQPEPMLLSEENAEPAKVTVMPFGIYATSPTSVSEIETNLPATVDPTEVGEIAGDCETMTVSSEGGKLVIYSPEATVVTVYDIDGRALRSIRLEAGRNVISLDLSGIVIIADTKVKL